MLEIMIPETEEWDELNQCFINVKATKIRLEHSLVSLSKWESKFKKPFLSKDAKTVDETLYYIKCMTLTQNVQEDVYRCLTREHINLINSYVGDPMTATTFSDRENKGKTEKFITSELIYYWMIALNIPFECQKWHLNRLLTLIKICNIKNQPDKKMGKAATMRNNSALNAARRKARNSKG